MSLTIILTSLPGQFNSLNNYSTFPTARINNPFRLNSISLTKIFDSLTIFLTIVLGLSGGFHVHTRLFTCSYAHCHENRWVRYALWPLCSLSLQQIFYSSLIDNVTLFCPYSLMHAGKKWKRKNRDTHSINMVLHKSQRTKTLNSGLIEG